MRQLIKVYPVLPSLFLVLYHLVCFLIMWSFFCLMFGDQAEVEAFNNQKAGKGPEENDM